MASAGTGALATAFERFIEHILDLRRRVRREALRGRVQDWHHVRVRARNKHEGDPREQDLLVLCFRRAPWKRKRTRRLAR
jgi:hypothetical protein